MSFSKGDPIEAVAMNDFNLTKDTFEQKALPSKTDDQDWEGEFTIRNERNVDYVDYWNARFFVDNRYKNLSPSWLSLHLYIYKLDDTLMFHASMGQSVADVGAGVDYEVSFSSPIGNEANRWFNIYLPPDAYKWKITYDSFGVAVGEWKLTARGGQNNLVGVERDVDGVILTHGDPVRFWDPTLTALLPEHTTELTAVNANTGRMGSENYLGGDH